MMVRPLHIRAAASTPRLSPPIAEDRGQGSETGIPQAVERALGLVHGGGDRHAGALRLRLAARRLGDPSRDQLAGDDGWVAEVFAQ
jgi:hypothetical protein